MHAAVVGVGLGFLVAAQLGPMSLFLIRSTLRAGWRVGLAVGAGIAVIDGVYAAAGAAGAASLLTVEALRSALGLVGAAVLVALGGRALLGALRPATAGAAPREVATPRRAFALSLAATASNPATIVSWAAIFAAASTAGVADAPGSAVALVAGVAVGSLMWVSLLTGVTAVARRGIGTRGVRVADLVAGLGLIGFGAALASATVGEA